MKNLLSLKPAKLLTHPHNMRRFYPSNDVREMANSIAAAKGVLLPLIVVEADEPHKYYVVDGNMRLAGARLLGADCPPLDCKLVDKSEAEQQLAMAIANGVRYDVDPVSEGLHYKALLEQGLSVRDISKQTGIYETRINNRKVLAELPAPIQKLIVEGKLPGDHRAARALLSVPAEKQVRLAERLAQNPNIKIKTIIAAAEKLATPAEKAKVLKRPAAELSGALKAEKKSASRVELRLAASKVCQSCNQYEGKLRETAEPAWSLIVHAADKTCERCPLKDVRNICGSCPAVQVLKALLAHD